MIRKKTVFVVGAGASVEVKMPIGDALTLNIKNSLRNSAGAGSYWPSDPAAQDIYESLCRRMGAQKMQRAALVLYNGLPTSDSIDEFLNNHREDHEVQVVGKSLVATEILKAERHSPLFSSNQSWSFDNIGSTWFKPLIGALTNGLSPAEADRTFEHVTFVSFNYDRCLEVALLRGLNRRFAIPTGRSAELMESCNIIHPWGFLGPLVNSASHDAITFGQENPPDDIWKQLSTYSENAPELRDRQTQVRLALREAQTLVFLGFSYNRQNMAYLDPVNGLRKVENIYGTAKGLAPAVREEVMQDLHNFAGPENALNSLALSGIDMGCAEFMREYFRALTS